MIKQLIPDGVCVKCKGCCRFAQADSVWSPSLLNEEIQILAKDARFEPKITSRKKICLVRSQSNDIFLCPFLREDNNECEIYSSSPLECSLYPFLINRRAEKIFLSVDLNCPFASENFKSEIFKEYVNYLCSLFDGGQLKDILKNNPHLLQAYQQVLDLVEIKI